MKRYPRVSVVIPTYNCDRYLAEAIDSVFSQQYQDYELLVIDDGSTDDTAELVKGYGDRLRYISQANQGVAVARNHGIQLARGELVAFLDADDVWLSHKLNAQVNLFDTCRDAGESVGIVHSGWQRVDHNLQLQVEVRPWKTSPILDLEGWLQWKPVLPSAMMFRRDWLLRADGFDPRFPPAEDTDLVLRLALMGCQTRWLEDVTTLYRQHSDSAMHKGLPQARSLTQVMHSFFSREDLPPLIKCMETEILYSTHVWIAWYLYDTQHLPEMSEHLRDAWNNSPYSRIETILHSIESFSEFSRNRGSTFDVNKLCQSDEWRSILY